MMLAQNRSSVERSSKEAFNFLVRNGLGPVKNVIIKCSGITAIKVGDVELSCAKFSDSGLFPIGVKEILPLSRIVSIEPITKNHLNIKYREFECDPRLVVDCLYKMQPTDIQLLPRFTTSQWTLPHIPQGKWDNWIMKGTPDGHEQEVKISSATVALAIQKLNLQPKNILFLGCGRGFEVRDFCSFFKRNFTGAKIVCIDSSKKQLAYARSVGLPEYIRHHGMIPEIIDCDFEKLADTYKQREKPDLIIGQGVFDRATLTYSQGFSLADQIKSISTPETIGLYTAYGLNLFDFTAWRSAGFEPLAGCHPELILNNKSFKPDYYAVKNIGNHQVIGYPDPIVSEMNERSII